MRISSLVLGILLFSQITWAQVDVTSELLLRPSAQDPNSTGLKSGRYKVKKNSASAVVAPSSDEMTIKLKKVKTLPGKKVSGSEINSEKEIAKNNAVVVPPSSTTTTSSSTTSSTLKIKSTGTEMEKLLFTQPAPAKTDVEKPVEKVETQPEVEEPTVSQQVQDLVAGNGGQLIEAYKEQVHPDDIRINRIEVTINPGVISNQSKSSYSFRNYNTFSPKISLGANFWMTPFMGLYGDYTTSMGSDVASDSSTGSRVAAQHEWTEIGFHIRKFFGMSRKSNSLQFGLHFSEYKFNVTGDDLHRVGLRSTGVGFHLMTRIPVAPSYSWVFGGKLIPRVQHREMATGIDLSSGSGGESTRVDLSFGGEFKLARQNQIIWDITSSFEKNQFNGEASLVDPEKEAKPKGVSVENGFFIFSLGYRWGQ